MAQNNDELFSDCARNGSKLVTCGEGEVCATLMQHHKPDSGEAESLYLGGETHFLIVC